MNPLSPTSYPIHVVRGLLKPRYSTGKRGVRTGEGTVGGCRVISRVAANLPQCGNGINRAAIWLPLSQGNLITPEIYGVSGIWEREREKLVQWGTMYCSWNSRATLRNCGGCSRCRGSPGVLPLNRVALFAAQITRESLDTRAPVESKATTTIVLRIVPYLGITRLVSRRFFFSYFLSVPFRSTKYIYFLLIARRFWQWRKVSDSKDTKLSWKLCA